MSFDKYALSRWFSIDVALIATILVINVTLLKKIRNEITERYRRNNTREEEDEHQNEFESERREPNTVQTDYTKATPVLPNIIEEFPNLHIPTHQALLVRRRVEINDLHGHRVYPALDDLLGQEKFLRRQLLTALILRLNHDSSNTRNNENVMFYLANSFFYYSDPLAILCSLGRRTLGMHTFETLAAQLLLQIYKVLIDEIKRTTIEKSRERRWVTNKLRERFRELEAAIYVTLFPE